MSSATYRKNDSRMVGEIIDGEAIIVDTETGCYFSLPGTGAFVWGLLDRPVSVTDIVQAVKDHYRCEDVAPEAAVEAFIGELERCALVVAGEASPDPAPREAPTAANGQAVFTPPVVNRYDDMKDFLLVDPIHEVDDTGWPNLRR